MKHIANLYAAELQPNRDPLTLNLFAGVFGILLVLMVVGALLGRWYVAAQQTTAAELTAQNAQVQRHVKQLQEQLQQAQHDQQLLREIESLQEKIAQRRRLMTQLQQLTQASQASFAQVLTDLARVDSEQVWLTRIVLANYEMTLQGQTTVANALPQWLANFSNYSTLRHRHFGVFELRDENTGSLHFTVGSTAHNAMLSDTDSAQEMQRDDSSRPQIILNPERSRR